MLWAVLCCAWQDHVPVLGAEALPHVLWSLAKLKTGMTGGGTAASSLRLTSASSGMVMSFVKVLAAEAGLVLASYDLMQLRR